MLLKIFRTPEFWYKKNIISANREWILPMAFPKFRELTIDGEISIYAASNRYK